MSLTAVFSKSNVQTHAYLQQAFARIRSTLLKAKLIIAQAMPVECRKRPKLTVRQSPVQV
jgi:hypothetical protein